MQLCESNWHNIDAHILLLQIVSNWSLRSSNNFRRGKIIIQSHKGYAWPAANQQRNSKISMTATNIDYGKATLLPTNQDFRQSCFVLASWLGGYIFGMMKYNQTKRLHKT